MVFNTENYPNMTQWFHRLSVPTEPSNMSLSVSLDSGQSTEWCSEGGLRGLFANPLQSLRPSFYRFLRDMIRFNEEAAGDVLGLAEDDPRRQRTVGQYLKERGYSEEFAVCYLLPMTAALWSSSLGDVLDFPVAQLVGFMGNHKMLQVFDRPEWKTVKGRSRQYTEKILALLGTSAKLSTPVTGIVPLQPESPTPKYELFTESKVGFQSSLGIFDHVVFACHANTARDLLRRASPESSSSTGLDWEVLVDLLGEIQYDDNICYVHSDTNLMPKRRAAWASWNCMGKSEELRGGCGMKIAGDTSGEAMEGGESGFGNVSSTTTTTSATTKTLDGEEGRMKAVYVTYYLNKLQNLDTDTPILVSLNPHVRPDPKLTYETKIMAHPQFTPKTLLARDRIEKEFQGKDGLWFCGAWQGYGFHEDGCRAGFEVATKISNVPLPWCGDADGGDAGTRTMVLAPPNLVQPLLNKSRGGFLRQLRHVISYQLPTLICKRMVLSFLHNAIQKGSLQLKMTDGSTVQIGNDQTTCHGCDSSPVTIRIFDDWFFVKVAMEYDLGLARSYMAGFFNVEKLEEDGLYDSVVRPASLRDESNLVLGDPVGLTRLFLLFVGNRDLAVGPMRSSRSHTYSNAFTNAAGLVLSRVGSFLNFIKYRVMMDNTERGGSLKNIHAHYDLSNDLFRTFLDVKTLMYSSAIYDAIAVPCPTTIQNGVVVKVPSSPTADDRLLRFRGTLEEAEMRKLDTLLHRAQIQPGQTMLDIGFGWGGLSIHAAKKYGCRVTGITLSVEQKALAEVRVKKEGLGHLIQFEVVDYRIFARRKENRQKFDRVLSCEMIEAVGHNHLGEFFWAVEQVLHPSGILVMEAITTPEARYESYLRTTDFINTIIFPGSCCPSLHALIDASYHYSTLTLEHIDNIGLHYAETLREWRRRFNASENTVRNLGFDDVFLRVWNYYLTYCEAGFHSQTENCLILVFSRPGCGALVPLCETRGVTQSAAMGEDEARAWLEE